MYFDVEYVVLIDFESNNLKYHSSEADLIITCHVSKSRRSTPEPTLVQLIVTDINRHYLL